MFNLSALNGQCTGYPVYTSISGGVDCGNNLFGELCFQAPTNNIQPAGCDDYDIRFSYDALLFNILQITSQNGGQWSGPTSTGSPIENMDFIIDENVTGVLNGCFRFQLQTTPPAPIKVELVDLSNPSSPPILSHNIIVGSFSTIGEPGQTKEITDYIGVSNGLLSTTEAASKSQQVIIEGTLEVNEDYTFGFDEDGGINNKIIMGPGAKIIVKNGKNLGFERADIHPCNSSWGGILIESQADLQMFKSSLSDATIGVEMQNNASFELNQTYFNNNDIGIGVFGPNPKNIDFTGWSGFGNNRSIIENGITGIHLENVINFDESETGNKLLLRNLVTGIHLDNSNVTISSYAIINSETGINEVSGNNIITCDNCIIEDTQYGIKTVGTSVFTVINSDFARNNYDIHKKPQTGNEITTIKDNQFYGAFDYNASGVNVFAQCLPSDLTSSISNNPTLYALEYNVHLSGIGKGVHNYIVEENGIVEKFATTGRGANVYFLDMRESSILGHGDVVSATRNFIVDGGGNIEVLQNTAECGISNVSLNGSIHSNIECNAFHRTYYTGGGASSYRNNIHIQNDCGITDIRGNAMSETAGHALPNYNLIYGRPNNTYANTGVQNFKGNTFNASQEGLEKAKNYSPFFLAVSNQYKVADDNTKGDDHFPYFDSAYDDWFIKNPEEEDHICDIVGGGNVNEPISDVLLRAVENGLAIQRAGLESFYGAEVAFDSRLKLYRNLVLLDEMNALPIEYDSLFNDLSTSDVAPFITFEQTYIQAVEASPDMIAKHDSITTLQTEIMAIEWLQDSVTGEITFITGDQAVYDDKMMKLRQVSQTHGDLLKAQQVQIDALLPTLYNINATASAQPTQSGQNQFEINKLLLERYHSGFTEFDTSELQIITSIADQCPVNGGEAVHTARALLTEAEGLPKEYDDQCVAGLSYGENTGQLQMETLSPQKLTVSPNPASEELTVHLPKNFIGTEIMITDIYGRIVQAAPVEGNRSLIFETQNWPSGIYFLSSGNGFSTKIIISH